MNMQRFIKSIFSLPLSGAKSVPAVGQRSPRVRVANFAQRSFNAAVQSLVNFGWSAAKSSYDTEIAANLASLRGQARDLELNNDYVRRYFNVLNTGVVFQGIWPRPEFKAKSGELDQDVNDSIKYAFKAWARKGQCDVTGVYSWTDILRVVLFSIVRDGEAFVRKIYGEEHGEQGFALEVIDAIYVDENLNQRLSDGTEIVMGIRKNKWGKPIEYYLIDPSQSPESVSINKRAYIVVKASEMIHIFKSERPRQTRGMSWLRSVNLRMIGAYLESELIAARVASHKMAFIVDKRGEGAGHGDDGYEEDDHGNLVQETFPAGIERLAPGEEVQVFDPKHPNENFDAFIKTELRAIAAGLGISYNSLTFDTENTSYSALRQSALEERDFFRTLQDMLIEGLCYPVYRDWLKNAVLVKAVGIRYLDLPKYLECPFKARSYPWFDPKNDAAANREALQSKYKSLHQVCEENGREYDEVLAERLDEYQKESSMGLIEYSREGVSKDVVKIA